MPRKTTLSLSADGVKFPDLVFRGAYAVRGLATSVVTQELFVVLEDPAGIFVKSWEDAYSGEPEFVGTGTCCVYADMLYRKHAKAITAWQLGTPLKWTFRMTVGVDALVVAGCFDDPNPDAPTFVIVDGASITNVPGPSVTLPSTALSVLVHNGVVWVLTAAALYANGVHAFSVRDATSIRVQQDNLVVRKPGCSLAITLPYRPTRE